MKFQEITAADLQQQMPSVWAIFRKNCSDDEEALNCILNALENFVYDVYGGASHFRALHRALDELNIESDYSDELYSAILNLHLLKDNKDKDDYDFADIDIVKFFEEHILFL